MTEQEYISYLEKRNGRSFTEGEKKTAIRYARLYEELKPFLDDVSERLPERSPQEMELIAHMERLEGRPLTEPEKNISIAQARMIGEIQD